jgi:hypothetical protein
LSPLFVSRCKQKLIRVNEEIRQCDGAESRGAAAEEAAAVEECVTGGGEVFGGVVQRVVFGNLIIDAVFNKNFVDSTSLTSCLRIVPVSLPNY